MSLGFDINDLRQLAGPAAYDRGIGYVDRVRQLVLDMSGARAIVDGAQPYSVDLAWDCDGHVAATCTCAYFADHGFCEHLVALGMAVLGRDQGSGTGADAAYPNASLVEHLATLDRDALLALVVGLLDEDGILRSAVEVDAVRAGSAPVDAGELTGRVTTALRTRGFVDYRESFAVARDADAVLDELSDLLDAGARDSVAPALLKALTRLRSITQHADDSLGVLGDACQRAAEMYARACRESNPDPVKLARWLVRFRLSSPGWPETPFEWFAPALDSRAERIYRKAVANAAAEAGDEWSSFGIRQMQLELLDHDGDVDGAVAFLSENREHVRYGAIIDRLLAVGRDAEALNWLDQAVAADRIWHADDEYHRSFDSAVRMYLSAGRSEDAIALRRRQLGRAAGPKTLRALLETADMAGRADTERAWAMELAREQAARPHSSGGALVRIALDAGDLGAAIEAQAAFGAGEAWQELADACVAAQPEVAIVLYQRAIDGVLEHADRRRYQVAIDYLVKLREVYRALGRDGAFADYAAGIREESRRRPTFIKLFDQRIR